MPWAGIFCVGQVMFGLDLSLVQGTHCTGKTGKMAKKNPCQGKHREFWKFCQNTGKTQGIWFVTQVVNSLILKVKDISVFAAKISIFSEDLDEAVLCM